MIINDNIVLEIIDYDPLNEEGISMSDATMIGGSSWSKIKLRINMNDANKIAGSPWESIK